MLIAMSLAAIAASLASAAPAASSLPPVVVTVRVTTDVTPSLVDNTLEEAAAIWRQGGFSVVWRRSAGASPSEGPPLAHGCDPMAAFGVVIGDERGHGPAHVLPLGWISFDDAGPAPEVYVSYRNAVEFLEDSRAVVGRVAEMPIAEREIFLGRAMGRALAHEIGHYLLGSKRHTPRGLMQATHTASSFFDRLPTDFRIDAEQRQQIAARIAREPVTVVRHPMK